MCEGGQKEKINTEQYQNDGLLLPSNMWHPPQKKIQTSFKEEKQTQFGCKWHIVY